MWDTGILQKWPTRSWITSMWGLTLVLWSMIRRAIDSARKDPGSPERREGKGPGPWRMSRSAFSRRWWEKGRYRKLTGNAFLNNARDITIFCLLFWDIFSPFWKLSREVVSVLTGISPTCMQLQLFIPTSDLGAYNKSYFFSILKSKAKIPHVSKSGANSSGLCFSTLNGLTTHTFGTVGKAGDAGLGLGTSQWRLLKASCVSSHPSQSARLHFIFCVTFYFLWTLTWRFGYSFKCVVLQYWSPSSGDILPDSSWGLVYKQTFFHWSSFQLSL